MVFTEDSDDEKMQTGRVGEDRCPSMPETQRWLVIKRFKQYLVNVHKIFILEPGVFKLGYLDS